MAHALKYSLSQNTVGRTALTLLNITTTSRASACRSGVGQEDPKDRVERGENAIRAR